MNPYVHALYVDELVSSAKEERTREKKRNGKLK